jgi:hypothetical protein
VYRDPLFLLLPRYGDVFVMLHNLEHDEPGEDCNRPQKQNHRRRSEAVIHGGGAVPDLHGLFSCYLPPGTVGV